ncbi:MAG: XdhC family protein, partial [Steroidobacteraceae bacterium]
MSFSLQRLLPLFERERTLHQPMVLATVVRSAEPTYAKPGAHMLLAGNGEYAGLVSGGYLEGDLAEHGRAVLAAAWRAQRAARLLLVVNSDDAAWPPGAAVSADDGEPFDTNAMATER